MCLSNCGSAEHNEPFERLFQKLCNLPKWAVIDRIGSSVAVATVYDFARYANGWLSQPRNGRTEDIEDIVREMPKQAKARFYLSQLGMNKPCWKNSVLFKVHMPPWKRGRGLLTEYANHIVGFAWLDSKKGLDTAMNIFGEVGGQEVQGDDQGLVLGQAMSMRQRNLYPRMALLAENVGQRFKTMFVVSADRHQFGIPMRTPPTMVKEKEDQKEFAGSNRGKLLAKSLSDRTRQCGGLFSSGIFGRTEDGQT
ncbi:hypothetical protein BO94DRAFT_575612 [Aspergillus sclerotioniger CBS 115572]|uniref:Uncharacterized protein n=1 Tax=Aspergillus sclerotioniger CBS 115572 TaxID=1450535 RepID=A0A317WJB7_9EURO|nr:hypothetical protein BO94DRAFT_575612 [Aspergillus sclerotioniger CBS 115572]PWY86546.1 hypothetical protein BO94DRAFT_575612 [Aspergillus sclerotioniger CBS 115572]